jgi:hypothetical protein
MPDPHQGDTHGAAVANRPLWSVIDAARRARQRELAGDHSDPNTGAQEQEARAHTEMVAQLADFIFNDLYGLNAGAQRGREKLWKKSKHYTKSLVQYSEEKSKRVKARIEECMHRDKEIEDGKGIDLSRPRGEWVHIFEILSSPHTRSGSLFDIGSLRRILEASSRQDKLPHSSSLQALLVIQDAWDHVDLYAKQCRTYKAITKVVYAFLLLTSVLITIMGLLKGTLLLPETLNKWIIMGLSVLSGSLASYMSFLDPQRKWQMLRGTTAQIESLIWAFRTRSGDFRLRFEGDTAPEELLHAQVKLVKESTTDLIVSTSIMKVFMCRHLPSCRHTLLPCPHLFYSPAAF